MPEVTRFALIVVLMTSSTFVWPQKDAAVARDAKRIRQVKQTPVSQLDNALPSITLEKWLRIEAGADANFHWEVNDCGEQTGTAADRGRDFPSCVEAQAVMTDQRTIVVSIAVGTSKKGTVGKSILYFAQLVTPRKTIDLPHLSDLPLALIQTHIPVNPEIAK